MDQKFYARPVLFVSDMDRTLDFYVNRLGFTLSWRYEEGGGFVAEAKRQGCVLIFSTQWPDKVGNGLMFISLDIDAPRDRLKAEVTAGLDQLRQEFTGRGVNVEDGWWGYKLLVIRDPDGNELYFNYPGEA